MTLEEAPDTWHKPSYGRELYCQPVVGPAFSRMQCSSHSQGMAKKPAVAWALQMSEGGMFQSQTIG
jgi:hypothetical protein